MHTHEIRSVCHGNAGPSLLVVRRARRPFDQRQRTIVHLLHPQIEWALRPAVTGPPGLPAKHQVVLDLLLGGEAEKQIARRLAKNEHTIHSRIKQIYRHFGVGSRAQLLAKFVATAGQK